METNLDPSGRIHEITGLTPRELYLFVASRNGLIPTARGIGAFRAEILATELYATAEIALQDHERFGMDLNFTENDTPNTPYEYYDIAEKIDNMRDDQAAFLEGFAAGFWAAYRDAEGSHS